MNWQDAIVGVIVALAAVHLMRVLVLPAFFKRSAGAGGCDTGCGSCPSNAATSGNATPAVFGLTLKPTREAASEGRE